MARGTGGSPPRRLDVDVRPPKLICSDDGVYYGIQTCKTLDCLPLPFPEDILGKHLLPQMTCLLELSFQCQFPR